MAPVRTLFRRILPILLLAPALPAAAQPVPGVELLFSDDGGSTFRDSIIVSPGDHYLLRVYFDNAGSAPGTAAAVTASLPAGFDRVAGSTRLCLEPADGEKRCTTDAGMGGAINESAVWTGQNLSISPTAGFFGNGTGLTSGILEIGKKRYFNLHECQYLGGGDRIFYNADPIAGTSAGNSAAPAAGTCASATLPGYALATSLALPLDLLGNRWLNFHECEYEFFGDRLFVNADTTLVGTNTKNAADLVPTCAGSAGSHHNIPGESQVSALDLLGRRYLNLNECRYQSGGDQFAVNATTGNNTNTSTVPDPAATCIAVAIGHNLVASSNQAIDLLDAARGHGFVEVEVEAGIVAGSFAHNAALDTAETAPVTATGALIVDAGVPPGPLPSVDLKYSHAGGFALQEDAMAAEGETIVVRAYFDNEGELAGSGAFIHTELPAGVTRVPGSTRICLAPAAGEEVCNGEAIDESAVWTGQALEIAPSAGLFGERGDLTAGALEIGKRRFLDFDECHYYNGFNDRVFANTKPGTTGTAASNAASSSAAATCAASLFGHNLVGGVREQLPLLGRRWLNVHECQYHFFFFDRILLNTTGVVGTNTSNVEDDSPTCAPTAGSHSLLPAESFVGNIDLLTHRYLNLHECFYKNGDDYVGVSAGPNFASNGADEPDAAASCPGTSGSHTLQDASLLVVDLLDVTRAKGFVEFRAVVSLPAGIYPQNATLETNEVAPVADTGNIVVVPGLLLKDGFETGDTSRWSATETGPR